MSTGQSDVDPSDRSVGKQTALGVGAKFATMTIGFAGTIFFARTLGPSAFGGFYLLLRLVEFSNLPIQGCAIAGKKRIAEYDTPSSEIVAINLITVVTFGSISLLLALLLRTPVQQYTGLDNAVTFFALLFIPLALFSSFRSFVEGRGRIDVAYWSDSGRDWLSYTIQIALVVYGLGIAGMVIGYTAATLLLVPVVVYYTRASLSYPSWETVRRYADFARYSVPNRFLSGSYNNFDLLLIGIFLSPLAAGYYEVAYRITMPATFISAAAGSLLMAQISSQESRDELVEGQVRKTLSFSSLLAIPIFFGTLAIAEPLVVTLYGSEYRSASAILIGLALYRLVRSQSTPLADVVDGLGRPDINLRVSVVTLALNIALGIPLILTIGVIGVVAATVLAETLRLITLNLFLRQTTTSVLLPPQLIGQTVAGLGMFGVVSIILRWISISSWINLVFVVAIGALTYCLFILLLSADARFIVAKTFTRFRRTT